MALGPPNLQKKALQTFYISKYASVSFQNFDLALRTSFFHIFSVVTLNQVILVPHFSESHPLSLQAIPILMIVAFM
jgi:hypothetical protein